MGTLDSTARVIDAEVDRATAVVRATRVVVAHDCDRVTARLDRS